MNLSISIIVFSRELGTAGHSWAQLGTAGHRYTKYLNVFAMDDNIVLQHGIIFKTHLLKFYMFSLLSLFHVSCFSTGIIHKYIKEDWLAKYQPF